MKRKLYYYCYLSEKVVIDCLKCFVLIKECNKMKLKCSLDKFLWYFGIIGKGVISGVSLFCVVCFIGIRIFVCF